MKQLYLNLLSSVAMLVGLDKESSFASVVCSTNMAAMSLFHEYPRNDCRECNSSSVSERVLLRFIVFSRNKIIFRCINYASLAKLLNDNPNIIG